MFRRSSYASVVSGSAGGSGQPPYGLPAPPRSGTFSHAGFANSHSTSLPQSHPSLGHSRHHSRTADADGHTMSASWGRGPLPSYTSQFGYLGGSGQDGAPSFFVPSYLRGSRYAERLEEAHRTKLAAHREYRSNHSSNAGSLSTSSSSVNLHKMVPSHRGLTHDVIERVPATGEEQVAPWPTKWSYLDKYHQLEVQGDGLEARFSGSSQKTHEDAASVRADHPMPRQCGIYYFEVTLVSKGRDGMIGVGFSGPKVPLSRIPGWEPESYAYHGDDGQCFSNTTSGKSYGPKFGALDVVGCGVNFRTGSAFFTKNGVNLGVAFKDIKTDRPWYPTVGMKKPGDTLRANFGQEPFVFDIDSMIEAEKASIYAEVNKTKVTIEGRPRNETELIHDLIAQYLAHDGYVETARAFADEVMEESRSLANGDASKVRHLNAEEDVDAINRQKIRSAILDGDIDKALKHTMAYYPSVLRDNEKIYFKLRCRKFIEMIRRCNEIQHSLSTNTPPPSKRFSTNGHSTAPPPPPTTDEYDVFDHHMELDEQFKEWNNNPSTTGAGTTDSTHNNNPDIQDPARFICDEFEYTKLMQETIKYGQELKAEFANDTRREIKKALEDTFALIAYSDARTSSLAPLLEESGRVPVAEELNGAILVSLGKSSSAALERLCQQTEALVSEIAEDGGPGAFVNVGRDFL